MISKGEVHLSAVGYSTQVLYMLYVHVAIFLQILDRPRDEAVVKKMVVRTQRSWKAL